MKHSRHFVQLVLCAAMVFAALAPGEGAESQADPAAIVAVNKTLGEFDAMRALMMRSLIRAQDLKLACLYGRSWGLDMPESVAEDILVEGLWVFDYLDGMDLSSNSLVSYGIATQHPDLQAELETFRSFLPEAAAMTAAYHDKVTTALAEAVEKVKAAAAAQGEFQIQTIPAKPFSDLPAQKLAGDGFNLGFSGQVLPTAHYGNFLRAHNYPVERLLNLAAEAGIDLFQPLDVNVFDWADVCKEEGTYDWSAADRILALLKKYGLPMHLQIDPPWDIPPDWLIAKYPGRAVLADADGKPVETNMVQRTYLTGTTDRRSKMQLVNLFDADIATAYAGYVRALITHIRDSGVRIFDVQLGNPAYFDAPYLQYAGAAADGRLRAYLKKEGIDIRKSWGVDADPSEVSLSPAWLKKAEDAAGAGSPAFKRMKNDLLRWREDEYFQYMKIRVEAVRAVAPDVPVCTSAVGPFEFNDSITGRNDYRLVKELGLVPWEFSGRNHLDDARRCLSPIAASAVSCSTGSGLAYTQYQASAFAHDARTILTGAWPIIRAFYHGEILVYPDMRWEWSALLSYRRFHERAQGMAPEMLNTRPAPQAAILHSDTSGKHQGFIKDFVVWTYGPRVAEANYNRIEAIGWGHLLDCLHMSHDVLTEEQVLAGGLSSYQMLIAPSAQALPAGVCERLREFVRNGGTLISTSALGEFGDDMEAKGAGQLADVLGADFAGFRGRSIVAESPMTWPKCDSGLYNILPWTPNPAKAKAGSDSLETLFCSFTPRDGATVLEKFTDGQPAAVMNTFGKGKAVAIGYPIGRECFLSDVYHMHYGNNWPDNPDSSTFTQGLCNWLELLLGKLEFQREATVREEFAARSTSVDASWPSGFMPRAMQEYRDYVWQKGPGRSVELIVRRREGNPAAYLEIYNRESTYGQAPGVVQFEASSKQVTVELRDDVKHLYDVSLGCPVKPQNNGGRAVFATMIEPAMPRMFAVSSDDTIRLYEGNRTQGGRTDRQLRGAVAALAGGGLPAKVAVIGAERLMAFLAERGAKGITIGCEDGQFMPAARRLADAIRKAYGKDVRITRNAPRIKANRPFFGCGAIGQAQDLLEQPDILMGSRNSSHYVARYAVTMSNNNTMPLPFMATGQFPGTGRAIVTLTRPFTRLWSPGRPRMDETELFREQETPQTLVISASDAAGVSVGVDELARLLAAK